MPHVLRLPMPCRHSTRGALFPRLRVSKCREVENGGLFLGGARPLSINGTFRDSVPT